MKTIYVMLLSLVCLTACSAPSAQSIEGKYVTLNPPLATHTGKKIEVLEIFWYGCPHCYEYEPHLLKWLSAKPKNVEFRLMPGILNPAWVPHARAYYTAVQLGVLDKIHEQLFDAIHKYRRNIFDEDSLKAFFVQQGVNGDEFSKVFDSRAIDEKMRQAYEEEVKAKITGVPSIIINGKYVTSPAMNTTNNGRTVDYDSLAHVMNTLIARESKTGS